MIQTLVCETLCSHRKHLLVSWANLQTRAWILPDNPLFILSTASGCGIVVWLMENETVSRGSRWESSFLKDLAHISTGCLFAHLNQRLKRSRNLLKIIPSQDLAVMVRAMNGASIFTYCLWWFMSGFPCRTLHIVNTLSDVTTQHVGLSSCKYISLCSA